LECKVWFITIEKNKAEEIVKVIENYKTINNKYPENLKEINLENEINGLKYNVEENGNYVLEYEMDGFKRQSFASKTKTWEILNWE